MIFERTVIPDVIICKPPVYGDERGYFIETYRTDKLDDFLGFSVDFCQDNESKSKKGVLRGMHYQLLPYPQSKLVRVVSGAVLDVAVDMRKNSPTFGKHVCVELNETNKHQLFIPRGFAHGFVVLSDEAVFAYKCDNYYAPNHESGFSFKDKTVDIEWQIPESELIVSEKDLQLPPFSEAILFESDKLY